MTIKIVFCDDDDDDDDDEWDSGISYLGQRHTGSPTSLSFIPSNLSRRLGEVFGLMVKIENMQFDVGNQVRLND